MKKRGHVMIWYKQIPNWLDEESKTWTSQQIYDFTESYIRALSRYTNGKIDEWDVLNEAIVFNGYRSNTWYEKVISIVMYGDIWCLWPYILMYACICRHAWPGMAIHVPFITIYCLNTTIYGTYMAIGSSCSSAS